MAIIWVHEALASGSGYGDSESGRNYTRIFDVLTDSFDDTALTVSAADDGTLAIPSAYSYFAKGNDTDYGSVVTRIAPERDQQYPLLWHVRVEYTVLRPNTSDGSWPGGTIDVTGLLPGIRIWGIPVAEVLREDVNGNAIVNSAGQPYNPLPEDIYYLKAIEVQTHLRSYNLDYWTQYEDSTNADTIWGRAPGTLLMVGPPSGTRKIDRYGTYWEIRLEIHYNHKGWKKRVPDMGKVKLVSENGEPPTTSTPAVGVMPITDKAGRPVTDDVPLDGNGQPLGQGLPWVFHQWTIKSPQAWAPLGLPALNIIW